MKKDDIHNKLTAVRPSVTHPNKWVFKCECGEETEARTYHVTSGHTKSCGCVMRATSAARAVLRNTTHGQKHTPEYRVWSGAKNRCTNKRSKSWLRYGGRGIKMCPRWVDSFENFIADMGKRPSSSHTLERKKNDVGYEPGNCVWALPIVQGNNKRNNVKLTHEGRTLSIARWADVLGVKAITLYKRVGKGWPVERILKKEKENAWTITRSRKNS